METEFKLATRKTFFLFVSSLFLVLGISFIFFTSKNHSQPTELVERQPQPSQVLSEASASSLAITGNLNEVKVIKVIDGDTIELENGQRVRYIGIDTPETVDPRKPVQCFGMEASGKNKELVESKTIRLEKDVSETDKYGRLLRYVYVGSIFVNDYLIKEGFAHASSYPPDIKYQNQFRESEIQAQSQNIGLWSSCQGQTSQAAPVDQAACFISSSRETSPLIKGNISSSGDKIYHVPGQKYYDKTVIDTARGEKWFCTEEEATGAGWRKSKL